MEEKSLQDLCREEKDAQHMTLQALSDRSGVPLSSVNNFFAAASKAPSVYNTGNICASLGVSMDEYFGIRPAVKPEEVQKLTERLHAAELEITRLRGIVDKQTAIMTIQRRNGFAISAISFAVIVALLVRLLVFDHSIPDAGLIINGETTLGAWLLIFGVAAVGVVMGALLLRMALRNTPKVEERKVEK